MKKKATLIALIFQCVTIVSLFLPWIFNEEYWKLETGTIGTFRLHHVTPMNFFGGSAQGGGILCYLTALVMALAVVALVLLMSGKTGKFTQIGAYAPAASFLLLLAATIYRCATRVDNGFIEISGHWYIKMGWLLYIVIALQLAAAVLSFLLARNKFKDDEPKRTDAAVGSGAAELKQFKDLLDTGAITQEEYEAKKKELLGL